MPLKLVMLAVLAVLVLKVEIADAFCVATSQKLILTTTECAGKVILIF